MQERQLAFGRHDEQAVRLRDAARHLREELRPRDADRQREPDLLEHPAPQAGGDLHRRAGDPFHSSHVEERLVDRQPLDERRHVVEDPIHGLARLGVGREARRDDDRLRAEPASLSAAHRRLDAEGLGLVARREHDTAADDHRLPAQLRIVPLLDRREEGVEVCVQDRRFA